MSRVVVYWFQEDDGSFPVRDWIDSLKPAQVQEKAFARILALAEQGHDVRRPLADYLKDKIYELRLRYKTEQYRMLFFFAGQDLAVITHGFQKTSTMYLNQK